MRAFLPFVTLFSTFLFAGEGALIDSMDAPKLTAAKEKASFEIVDGKSARR